MSPTQKYRPDYYGCTYYNNKNIKKQIIMEAEIKQTLMNPHSRDQIAIMYEYIVNQRVRNRDINGYLVIPKGKDIMIQATMLLKAIVPDNSIIVIQKGI